MPQVKIRNAAGKLICTYDTDRRIIAIKLRGVVTTVDLKRFDEGGAVKQEPSPPKRAT